MKQHIPWRTVSSKSFNKDKFRGNNEVINDWDLPKKVYVYEPQTLADLGPDANELDYQKLWNNFRNGGHIYVYLVPYAEMPELDIDVTSEAGDWQGLSKNGVIAGYTNVRLPERPTKRFYSFEELKPSSKPIELELWEDNNLSEVINNDGSFKQTSFTFTKFEPFDGGESSYYRDVRFFYGIGRPQKADYVQIEQTAPHLLGNLLTENVLGETIRTNVEAKKVTRNISGDNVPFYQLGYFESDITSSLSYSNSIWYPQFLVPRVSGNKVNWNTPWVWEYMFANEQIEGKYKWSMREGISGNNEFSEDVDKISGTNATTITSEYYWLNTRYEDGEDTNKTIVYMNRNKENSFTDAQKRFEYFIPYATSYALPYELSCHGALYVEDGDDTGGGLFNLNYTADGTNGARPFNVFGKWAGRTSMMVVDYAYDPTVFGTTDPIDYYLTKPEYGVFYMSEKYLELIDEILNGETVYQGTDFIGDIGVLSDITDKNIDTDIRKWNPGDRWHMLLAPWDIITMSREAIEDDENNQVPYLLNTDVRPAPTYPKFDGGWTDIPTTLTTNAGFPFYGNYIDEAKAAKADKNYPIPSIADDIAKRITLKVGEPISSIRYNYFAFDKGSISIKFYRLIDGFYYKTEEFVVLNERSQGRSLSGGTQFTWL